jgi:hypothetical protein
VLLLPLEGLGGEKSVNAADAYPCDDPSNTSIACPEEVDESETGSDAETNGEGEYGSS